MDPAGSGSTSRRELPVDLIANVQLLRGVAATMVLFVHLGPLFQRAGLSANLGFCRAGVDIFFVISGFIMMRIVEARRPTPLQFIANRLIRIAPVYYLCTVIFFVAATTIPSLAKDEATIGVLIKSLLFLPHGKAPFYPLLFVGWTLNYEAYFYALLAALLFVPMTASRMIGAMAIMLFVPVALVWTGAFDQQPVVFYGALMVFEFVAGMGLALLYPGLHRVPVTAAGAAIVAGVLGMIAGDRFPDVERLVAYGLPAALVVAGALVLERRGLRATSRLALTWGAVSYSLYVTHPLAVSGFNHIAERMIAPRSAGAVGFVFLAIVGVFAFAYATYRGFERPVDKLLKQMGGRPARVVEGARP